MGSHVTRDHVATTLKTCLVMQNQYPPPPMYNQTGPPVITTQPGAQVVPAAQGAAWMPVPQPMSDVPAGLEYLTYLDLVIIKQIKELLEIITDWETRNKYVLKNANGEQAYYAFEESSCCERQFCGNNRGFIMHVVDNFKREVLTITREFKFCGGGCGGCMAFLGCCQQEAKIISPTYGLLGIIRQRGACMAACFDVLDADGQEILKIDGPCCCAMIGCNDKEFPIMTKSNEVIGAITKKWGGCFREAFTDADTFQVNYSNLAQISKADKILNWNSSMNRRTSAL